MLQHLIRNRFIQPRSELGDLLPEADRPMPGESRVPTQSRARKRPVHVLHIILIAVKSVNPGSGVRAGVRHFGLVELVDFMTVLDEIAPLLSLPHVSGPRNSCSSQASSVSWVHDVIEISHEEGERLVLRANSPSNSMPERLPEMSVSH